MSLSRFAKRRDANDSELVKIARQMGAQLWPLDTPCDYLLLWRQRWYPVEIKVKKGTYTDAQKTFRTNVFAAGGAILTWRSSEDVVNDLNRLVI
jgi:hypothetical protein